MSTLMLVDDDGALQGVLLEALHRSFANTHVVASDSWSSALSAADSLDAIDLLLVDYHLGPQTGIDLARLLRARFPKMKTLLYTGRATQEVEAEAEAFGAICVWKPQRLRDLMEVVRSTLAD